MIAAGVFVTMHAQTASLRGQLQDAEGKQVSFANVALFQAADSALVKVETTNEAGIFQFSNLRAGRFFIKSAHVGFAELRREGIVLEEGRPSDLGVLSFAPASTELAQVTVSAQRQMVEVKPDRTVFNVQGTINSTGSDALNLLRKAPAVTVDNNDNISVLGRAGVLLYVDGKRIPIAGEELSNYLQNIPAEQIDRIDIITAPGAKYEAEGNAGIIDIRLKKDQTVGANGSLNSTYSIGVYHRLNLNGSGNYRNKKMNLFGSAGLGDRVSFSNMDFESFQNGLRLGETFRPRNAFKVFDYRLGADFFLHKKHTIGFLVRGGQSDQRATSVNRIEISRMQTPTFIDSILLANTRTTGDRSNQQANLNYRFDNSKGRTINIDVDYGHFNNKLDRYQDNQYAKQDGRALTGLIYRFDTPTEIGIYTAKADVEEKLKGGVLGFGAKISRVVSDNSFLVFDVVNAENIADNRRSNTFNYDEKVYAGYVNFNGRINPKWNFSAGLRAEKTDAVGNLKAFLPELQKPPVELNYLSWFPSAGLTWQASEKNTYALNYSRRINRPDYNVLNPFNNQLSQLSYERGNPFLRPEIVNNVEIGYTYAYRYNFKLGYSRTTDQITRLIAPDAEDSRANFISWENLAKQTVAGFNVSAPFSVNKWWEVYANASASYLDNQADYGNGAVVDIQAFTYNIYQQSTFKLPAGWRGEVSGWFSGPGIWGGVFEYETSWSLDLGLQKKFLKEALNLRLSASDIFFQSGWDGVSVFNGLVSAGSGRWDSRRVAVSLNYNFGNQNIKSRKRKTGLEEEARRTGGD